MNSEYVEQICLVKVEGLVVRVVLDDGVAAFSEFQKRKRKTSSHRRVPPLGLDVRQQTGN